MFANQELLNIRPTFALQYKYETLWRVIAHKKLFTADPKLAGALKCTDAQIRNSNRDRERDK